MGDGDEHNPLPLTPVGPDPAPRSASRPSEARAWPAPRRSLALPGLLATMLAVGVASGAYMLRHTPLPPDSDGGPRCARLFDARLHAARGGTDSGLAALADAALAARCGRTALEALDAIGPDGGEPVAWATARFFDPDETDEVHRQAATADPARAATLYASWSSRSPRMAEALRRLCATRPPAHDDDPRLGRACGT